LSRYNLAMTLDRTAGRAGFYRRLTYEVFGVA
jgi:hypothetical protein